MNLNYWKLIRAPFDQRVNPRWFFASPRHQAMLVHLRGLVERRMPVFALAGGPGVGKSMVAAVLAQSLAPQTFPVVRVSTVPVTARDLLQETIQQFEQIEPPATEAQTVHASRPVAVDESALVKRLRELLAPWRQAGQHPLMILETIDALGDDELLRLLRTVRSLGCGRTPSATVLLVAGSDLVVRLPRLAALGERLFPQCLLESMTAPETAGYISHRMRLAGGNPAVFSVAALELIHDLTSGVARRINRLCDFSLLVARGDDCGQVYESHVWTAQQENRVLSATRTATAPRPHGWKRLSGVAPAQT